MLKKLLKIKKKKEDRILQAIQKNKRLLDENRADQMKHRSDRSQNAKDWRVENEKSIPPGQKRLEQNLFFYNRFYDSDRDLMGRLSILQSEQAALEAKKQELKADLKKNRIEQEKIQYMIEHADD